MKKEHCDTKLTRVVIWQKSLEEYETNPQPLQSSTRVLCQLAQIATCTSGKLHIEIDYFRLPAIPC